MSIGDWGGAKVERSSRRVIHQMRPEDIQQVGEQLAIKWDDGSESFVSLERMRRSCPCASCHGETDILGNIYKGPKRELSGSAFELRRLNWVGGYAISPVWGDGHATGLYSFELLKGLGEE